MKIQWRVFLMIITLLGSAVATATPRPNGAGLASAINSRNAADVNSILSQLNISGVNGDSLISAVGRTISASQVERLITLAAPENAADAQKLKASETIFQSAILMNQSSSLASTGSGMLARTQGSQSADATLVQDGFNAIITLAVSSMDGSRGNESVDINGLTQIAAEFGRHAGNPTMLRETIRPIINANLVSQGKQPLPAEADPIAEIKNCR